MSGFSIRHPYFIFVVGLMLLIVGAAALARMPVDLFPAIHFPEVVVATFYSGMPPEDIESDITNRFERFFTLAAGSTIWSRGRSPESASSRRIFSQAPARRRYDRTLQPCAGRSAAPAARHAAAGGAEIRCLQPAGMPGHAEGSGPHRNAAARLSGSSRFATRSRQCRAPKCRRRSAESTGR